MWNRRDKTPSAAEGSSDNRWEHLLGLPIYDPTSTNHPKSFPTTTFHAERLAGTAPRLGNAQGLLTQAQKHCPGGLGKIATHPKYEEATTTALFWFQPLVPEMSPATSPALLSSMLDGDISSEGVGLFPPAHRHILAISRMAAETDQHRSTMLAG